MTNSCPLLCLEGDRCDGPLVGVCSRAAALVPDAALRAVGRVPIAERGGTARCPQDQPGPQGLRAQPRYAQQWLR